MKHNVKNKLKIASKRILIMFIIICNLFPMLFSGISFADEISTSTNTITIERLGNFVSNFGINFYKNWSSKDINTSDRYDTIKESVKGEIKTSYNDTATADGVTPDAEKYEFSNKSWIDFCYKNSLGIKDSSYYPVQQLSNKTYFEDLTEGQLEDLNLFVRDNNETTNKNPDENVADITELMNSGKVLPGDIIYTTEHEYLLFVGGTKVLYAQAPVKDEGAIRYEFLQDYFQKVKRKYEEANNGGSSTEEVKNKPIYGVVNIYRPTMAYRDAIGVQESSVNLIYNNKGYYDINTKYQGIAKGNYEGSTHSSVLGLIVKFLIEAVSWIINYTLYIVRAVIVGWVGMIESLAQFIILKLSGHSSKTSFTDPYNGISSTSYSGERVTVESLFYNQVPITDANFFNFETAGGYSLIDEDGNPTVLYNLRRAVAQGYVICRNISIAVILFVLIYMGIRMALSSISERKAQYKKQLIGWVTALAIVIFIHFFMYTVLFINDALLGLIQDVSVESAQEVVGVSTSELSLYDAIRTKAYSFNFMDGTVGLIFYIILVYFLIRFFLIYMKRMFATYLLAMTGTFVGAKYAFDKASGKRSSSLSKWIRDYSFNVLLQSIHALIYTLLMTIALKVALTSFVGIIIAIVVLQFLLEADKIFIKIFGVNSKGGLFEDTDKPENYFTILGKFKFMKRLAENPIKFGKNVFNMDKGVPKYLAYLKYYQEGDEVRDIEKRIKMERYRREAIGIGLVNNMRISKYEPIRKLATRLQGTKWYMNRSVLYGNASYELKKNMYEYIKGAKKIKKQRFKRNLNYGLNFALGAATTIGGVGMLTEGFATGLHAMSTGVNRMGSGINRTDARRYRKLQIPGSIESKMSLQKVQEMREREKEEKALKGTIGKQESIVEIAKQQEGINILLKQLIDERDRQLATLTNAEEKARLKEEFNDEIKYTIRQTNRTYISAYSIRKAVDRFLYNNGKTTIEPDDFDGILDELQKILDDRIGNKIDIDEETRNRLRAVIGDVNDLAGKDRKKAAQFFEEKISEPGVIQIEDVQFSTDSGRQAILEQVAEKLRKINAINQDSILKNKGAATNYNSIIKELVKKL